MIGGFPFFSHLPSSTEIDPNVSFLHLSSHPQTWEYGEIGAMGAMSEIKKGKSSREMAFGKGLVSRVACGHSLPHFGNDQGLCGSERIGFVFFSSQIV